MMSRELLVGVIVILSICSSQAQSPSERCDLKGGTGTVCNDCLHTVDCKDLSTQIECGGTTICDLNIVDGFCIEADSTTSPICMCATNGKCLVDPNSGGVLLDCATPLFKAIETVITPCNNTAPIFDPDPAVCACVEIEDCPPCGFIASGPDSTCIENFIFCGGSTMLELSCNTDECYNSTTCQCNNPTCGACGYKAFEGEPTKYIYCGDGDDKELPCPSETIYDPDSCVCVSEEACPTPPPTECPLSCPPTIDCPLSCPPTIDCPTTDPTSVCLACGLEAGSASCSEYYACDDNGRTGGPYNCPGTLCFDAATCNCV